MRVDQLRCPARCDKRIRHLQCLQDAKAVLQALADGADSWARDLVAVRMSRAKARGENPGDGEGLFEHNALQEALRVNGASDPLVHGGATAALLEAAARARPNEPMGDHDTVGWALRKALATSTESDSLFEAASRLWRERLCSPAAHDGAQLMPLMVALAAGSEKWAKELDDLSDWSAENSLGQSTWIMAASAVAGGSLFSKGGMGASQATRRDGAVENLRAIRIFVWNGFLKKLTNGRNQTQEKATDAKKNE